MERLSRLINFFRMLVPMDRNEDVYDEDGYYAPLDNIASYPTGDIF